MISFKLKNMSNILNEQLLEDMFIKAYYDKFEEDLKNKKYDTLIKFLDEIRTKLCSFVPNRPDLHNNIFETIDTTFIESMLRNDAMDNNYIFNLIQYIINQLKEFDSLENERNYEMWKTMTCEQLQNNVDICILLPKFFREVFFRLDSLEESINDFKNSSIYKNLVSNK